MMKTINLYLFLLFYIHSFTFSQDSFSQYELDYSDSDTMEEFIRVSDVPKAKVKNVKIADIYFEEGVFELTSENLKILDNMILLIKHNSNLKIHLKGQTATDYDDDFHLQLSELRANTVKDYMIKKSIKINRIETSWTGKNGLKKEKNDYEKQLNRKVSITIIN